MNQSQPGTPSNGEAQKIGAAIADVSERASVLVREEIELARAEISEKAATLVRGAVVGAAAGIFIASAVIFVLLGCAWLLYYYLPIGNSFTYFYGFFAMAVILLLLGLAAGLIAARAMKRSTPPVPNMAIDEARKIRQSVTADGAPRTEAASPPAGPPAPPVRTGGDG